MRTSTLAGQACVAGMAKSHTYSTLAHARIILEPSSEMLVGGGNQLNWQHGIIRCTDALGERINLISA
ncbi:MULTISPECIES: hypothetical protein [Agrobacterium]|uniref:hypothetical protein n=1 Tax=Agrobacterium TaxID=357 RepID=UPI001146EE12|nr:hypothetical protein [Agrobacterium sp. 13-2099-1-2]NSY46507.1 hypothetical protein [Agrobacterium tumefaciens]UZX45253.1 hypothetical protein A6U84_23045 [Agrobacterium sp. 13-2099-1-2]